MAERGLLPHDSRPTYGALVECIRVELSKGNYEMPGDALPYQHKAFAIAEALTRLNIGWLAPVQPAGGPEHADPLCRYCSKPLSEHVPHDERFGDPCPDPFCGYFKPAVAGGPDTVERLHEGVKELRVALQFLLAASKAWLVSGRYSPHEHWALARDVVDRTGELAHDDFVAAVGPVGRSEDPRLRYWIEALRAHLEAKGPERPMAVDAAGLLRALEPVGRSEMDDLIAAAEADNDSEKAYRLRQMKAENGSVGRSCEVTDEQAQRALDTYTRGVADNFDPLPSMRRAIEAALGATADKEAHGG